MIPTVPFGRSRFTRGAWRSAVTAVAFAPLAACYATHPFETGVTPEGEVAQFELNDRGQEALTPSVGANVRIIEGRVTAFSGSALTVAVSKVVGRNNVPETWGGEPVEIDRGFFRSAEVRRFDRTRSALVAGGLAAAVFGFLASRSLFGQGASSTDRPPPINGQ